MIELVYPAEPAPLLPKPTYKNPGIVNLAGEEIIPVVDQSAMVIGRTARSWAHGGTFLLHPSVHLHFIDRKGRLLLQKRSKNKKFLPGLWDSAVGGHVSYGESIQAALHREAFEELGKVDFNPTFLVKYLWESQREKELAFVFAAIGSLSEDISNEEVEQVKYFTFPQIDSMREQGVLTPDLSYELGLIKDKLLALL